VSAISVVDTVAHINGWRHHHIADKALLAAGLVLCALLLPPWPASPMVIVTCLAVCVLARISLRDFVTVIKVSIGFIVVGALATSLTIDVHAGVPVGFGDWPAALNLAGRSIAGTSAVAVFALTVPIPELLARLRQLGVPAIVCELSLLMYRMIAVGLHRLRQQRLAQASRLGYVGFRQSVASAAVLMSATFVGSLRQAERLQVGLAARGFDGTLFVLTEQARHCLPMIAMTLVVLLSIIGVSAAVAM
jgi:cobalt/nickel transport system permease protein